MKNIDINDEIIEDLDDLIDFVCDSKTEICLIGVRNKAILVSYVKWNIVRKILENYANP